MYIINYVTVLHYITIKQLSRNKVLHPTSSFEIYFPNRRVIRLYGLINNIEATIIFSSNFIHGSYKLPSFFFSLSATSCIRTFEKRTVPLKLNLMLSLLQRHFCKCHLHETENPTGSFNAEFI